MESFLPDIFANMNAIVYHEGDLVMQDVENENDAKSENVVVTGYHHDRANATLLRGARRDGLANVSPPYTEIQRKLSSLSRAMMPARCATHKCDISFVDTAPVLPNPRSEWMLSNMSLSFFAKWMWHRAPRATRFVAVDVAESIFV